VQITRTLSFEGVWMADVFDLDELDANAEWLRGDLKQRKERVERLLSLLSNGEPGKEGKPASAQEARRAPVPDKARFVFLAFSYTLQDQKELGRVIFEEARRAYDEALTASIAEVGCSGPGHLTGGLELKALKERSLWAASKIADTYNKYLDGLVGNLVQEWKENHGGTEEGLTRLWLAKQTKEALEKRWKWKQEQIGITEKAFAVDRARLDFWRRNAIEGQVRVLPTEAVCEVCQGYVDRGWVPLQEAEQTFELPAHPNCPHYLIMRALEDTIPPCDELWRGGTTPRRAKEARGSAKASEGWDRWCILGRL
jgi:hypothetical protein